MQQTVLAENVTSLAIRYYGTAVDSDGEVVGAGWQLQWQQQEDLPRLVMVMLQQRGGKHWPLLVAHPRLALARPAERMGSARATPGARTRRAR